MQIHVHSTVAVYMTCFVKTNYIKHVQERLQQYYRTRAALAPHEVQRAQSLALDICTEIQGFLRSRHPDMPLGEMSLGGSLLDDLQVHTICICFFLSRLCPSLMSYSKMLDECHLGLFLRVFRWSVQTTHVCWCLYSWKPLCGVSSRERKRCSHIRCTGWSDGSMWNIFPEDAATGTGGHMQIKKYIFHSSGNLHF